MLHPLHVHAQPWEELVLSETDGHTVAMALPNTGPGTQFTIVLCLWGTLMLNLELVINLCGTWDEAVMGSRGPQEKPRNE